MKFKDFDDFLNITDPPLSVIERLEPLKMIKERDDFHPESSIWDHIKIVTERLIPVNDINLIFTGILHDLFKYDTARINPKNGYMTFPGHDHEVAIFIEQNQEIRDWIIKFDGDPNLIKNLCEQHMRFHQLDKMRKKKQEDLINQPYWGELRLFCAADNMLSEFNLNDLELKFENDDFMRICGSCDNFFTFIASAGFYKLAKSNCLCRNPKAMIDMWDKKCNKWIINPRYLEIEQ